MLRESFKLGWDQALRSDPRVLALVEALETIQSERKSFGACPGIAKRTLTAWRDLAEADRIRDEREGKQ